MVEYGMSGIYEAFGLILITIKLVKFMHTGSLWAIVCHYLLIRLFGGNVMSLFAFTLMLAESCLLLIIVDDSGNFTMEYPYWSFNSLKIMKNLNSFLFKCFYRIFDSIKSQLI